MKIVSLSIDTTSKGENSLYIRKTVSRDSARRLGQLSSPGVSPPVGHVRTPIILTHHLPIVYQNDELCSPSAGTTAERSVSPPKARTLDAAHVDFFN